MGLERLSPKPETDVREGVYVNVAITIAHTKNTHKSRRTCLSILGNVDTVVHAFFAVSGWRRAGQTRRSVVAR